MQQRLVELISQLSNDEITAELLRVNDGLNNLFLRYHPLKLPLFHFSMKYLVT